MAKAKISIQPAATQAPGARTRILALRAKNIKSVREVEIDDIGEIHEIRGDSGQGKTTILEAIEGALRGLDPAMVRNGETAAEIELTLSTATINRIIPREGKETLMVRGADGSPVEKAKDFLATICGPSAFRPIEWVRLGGGEARGRTERLRRQRDQLLEALPLSVNEEIVAQAVADIGPEYVDALGEVNLRDVRFDQHALIVCGAIEKACYDYRALQNARADEAENRLKLAPAPGKAAPSESVGTWQARLDSATQAYHRAAGQAANQEAQRRRAHELKVRIDREENELPDEVELRTAMTNATVERDDAKVKIERLRAELRAAEEALAEAQDQIRQAEALQVRIETLKAWRAELRDIDTTGSALDDSAIARLQAEMEQARDMLDRRRLQDAHDAAAQAALDARQRAERFGALVKLFRDDLPKALIESANLPVPDLGVDGDTVTKGGVPIHQLGTSDQIRVGVLLASALNPGSAFVLVDGAESMGKSDRVALAEAARDLGLQLIMTYVDESARPAEHVTVMQSGQALVA